MSYSNDWEGGTHGSMELAKKPRYCRSGLSVSIHLETRTCQKLAGYHVFETS